VKYTHLKTNGGAGTMQMTHFSLPGNLCLPADCSVFCQLVTACLPQGSNVTDTSISAS